MTDAANWYERRPWADFVAPVKARLMDDDLAHAEQVIADLRKALGEVRDAEMSVEEATRYMIGRLADARLTLLGVAAEIGRVGRAGEVCDEHMREWMRDGGLGGDHDFLDHLGYLDARAAGSENVEHEYCLVPDPDAALESPAPATQARPSLGLVSG